MMVKEYLPFSPKVLAYLKRTNEYKLNVFEGGKRASKNVGNCLMVCRAIDLHDEETHLVAGVSIGNAMTNIVNNNGFGLLNYFAGRCRLGEFEKKTCLFIKDIRGNKKKIFVVGGGKLGDKKYIQGYTLGVVYITEVNNLVEEFVMETFDRIISARNPKIFHDLNPKGSRHWYYQMIEEKGKINGYNYGHSTLLDNPVLSNEQIQSVLNEYDKDTVYYKRDILGQRIDAEGKIYKNFNPSSSENIINNFDEKEIAFFSLGVDIGNSNSSTCFVLIGITFNYKKIIVVDEFRLKDIEKNETPELIIDYFKKYCKMWKEKYKKFHFVYSESAEQTYKNSFQIFGNTLGLEVHNSDKKTINDRINTTCLLLSSKRLLIMESCKNLIKDLEVAVWDEQESKKTGDFVRLKDKTITNDTLDAFEYSFSSYLKYFL